MSEYEEGASPKACPILVSAPIVRALFEGRKTQTRRLFKPQPVSPGEGAYFDAYNGGPQWNWWAPDNKQYLSQIIRCSYGKPGDLLWVQEAVACECRHAPIYKADLSLDDAALWRFRPSIHMPRWASRLTLELTEVRVERLQEISEYDSIEEGIDYRCPNCGYTHRDAASHLDHKLCGTLMPVPQSMYRSIWESINGEGSWDANPWVWALSFRVHQQNIDAVLACQEVA